MQYVYRLRDKEGNAFASIQEGKYTTDEVLKAFQEDDPTIVSCEYVGVLETGCHLCGCGNIVKGPDGLLCPECQEAYGHKWESEL